MELGSNQHLLGPLEPDISYCIDSSRGHSNEGVPYCERSGSMA